MTNLKLQTHFIIIYYTLVHILVLLYFKTLNKDRFKVIFRGDVPVIMAVLVAGLHPTKNNFKSVPVMKPCYEGLKEIWVDVDEIWRKLLGFRVSIGCV